MKSLAAFGCLVYVVALVSLLGASLSGPERWWWSGLNMYLPQAAWLLPALILVPLCGWQARHWLWLPAMGVALVAGPLMGFTWSVQGHREGVRVRVMTYNVQSWVARNISAIAAEIAHANPDILCLQDARGALDGQIGVILKDRHVAAFGQYVIASRFPVIGQSVGNIPFDEHPHTYLKAAVDVRGKRVIVASAHFLTSRDALSAFRSVKGWKNAVSLIKNDFENRLTQARLLSADLASSRDPVIVTGDFNVPSTSMVFDVLGSVGRDAFAEGGRGYGYTFGHSLGPRQSFVRIDHILISQHFDAIQAYAGGARGSDHRPMIADLVLRED